MKKSKNYIFFVSILILLIVALLVLVGLWSEPRSTESQSELDGRKAPESSENEPTNTSIQSPPLSEKEFIGDNLNLTTAVIQVAKSNIPAVVHIEVIEGQEVANPFFPFENNPFFHKFFGLPKKMPKKFKRQLIGVGTGMITDDQGHILTNHHVVGGANKILVNLADGKQYTAKVLGSDPKTDLSVIQIQTKDSLPHVTFGNSDQVQVGQWVVAIGQPRNLAQSVTQGIISAKHRTGITDPSSYEDFLQTDAAINPGNSGGPLLTLHGEVVGINSAILSQSGGFEGIGFAIPSNMAVHVLNALIKYGKVDRGWLGVSIQDMTPELAKSFGLETTKGALNGDITKDGPGDRAGLKKGDVILKYENKDVQNAASLRNFVANTPIGKEITISVWRNKKIKKIHVEIGNLEKLTKVLAASLKSLFGVKVRPVTIQEVQQYGLQGQEGVTIEWIDPKGPLGKVGFEVEDILLAINGRPIEDMEGLASAVASLPRHQSVAFLVLDHRSGQTGYIKVELG